MSYQGLKTTAPGDIPPASEISKKIRNQEMEDKKKTRKYKEEREKKISEYGIKYKELIIGEIAKVINCHNRRNYRIKIKNIDREIHRQYKDDEFITDKKISEIVLKIAKAELRPKGYKCKIEERKKRYGRLNSHIRYKYYLQVEISSCCIIL